MEASISCPFEALPQGRDVKSPELQGKRHEKHRLKAHAVISRHALQNSGEKQWQFAFERRISWSWHWSEGLLLKAHGHRGASPDCAQVCWAAPFSHQPLPPQCHVKGRGTALSHACQLLTTLLKAWLPGPSLVPNT